MAEIVYHTLIEQPVFRTYVFYVAILSLKLLAMSVLTSIQRFKHSAFANPEDAGPRKLKVNVNENVERVRRAHLNDLENIPIFFVVALIYLTTNPPVFLATMLIRLFTISRFIHSFVYAVVVLPQPSRALSFAVGYFITGYMAVNSIFYYLL
ncbi:hypothetical protein ABEB36_002575 [Hypothenemus hampei]|uniref:Microsomal glutathione S-transferase 1 n=1 Tax=Hypothenemus hampei TaxID=57062 RepID=A0ABD1F683_HYPHA